MSEVYRSGGVVVWAARSGKGRGERGCPAGNAVCTLLFEWLSKFKAKCIMWYTRGNVEIWFFE